MTRVEILRPLFLIIAGAILVRLLLFGYLSMQQEQSFFVLGDSNGYIRIAQNIESGVGFSQYLEPPHLPDSMRTPLFPAALAASLVISNSYIPVILLQIMLSGVLVFLAYRMTFLISGRERLALIAAALMAFEPYSMFINTSVLTETLFATLFIAGSYMTLRFLKTSELVDLSWASTFFGIAALTRPIGEFLPVILLILVFLYVPWRRSGKFVLAALIPFLLLTGPWLARNYIIFGVPALSSGGFQNVYSDLGGAIIAYRDHISWPEAKLKLEEDFARRHGFDVATIQQDLSKSPSLFREGLLIALGNPKETILVSASIALTFFTNDAWVYYLQRWEILPRYDITFSPTYTLVTEGPFVTAKKVLSETGGTLIVPLLGRLFWVAASLLYFIGTMYLISCGGISRRFGIALLLLVFYLLTLSASVGLGINGRFRYPANALFFTAAAFGGSLIVHYLRERLWLRIRT